MKSYVHELDDERRASRRMAEPFAVTTLGLDASGARFRFDTVAVNVSRGGLYLYMPRRLCPAAGEREGHVARMFLTVWFSPPSPEGLPDQPVAALGKVLRAEPRASGVYGVAVQFTRCRKLR